MLFSAIQALAMIGLHLLGRAVVHDSVKLCALGDLFPNVGGALAFYVTPGERPNICHAPVSIS